MSCANSRSLTLLAVGALALLMTCVSAARCATAPPSVGVEPKEYKGPFTTQVLYTMCSRHDATSREKCHLYIQGLLYGLNTGKAMQDESMPVCLPSMSPEQARVQILRFIRGTTGGRPSNNKDGGDWMAFMGVAAGNLCDQ